MTQRLFLDRMIFINDIIMARTEIINVNNNFITVYLN